MAMLRHPKVPERAFCQPVGFVQMVKGRCSSSLHAFADNLKLS